MRGEPILKVPAPFSSPVTAGYVVRGYNMGAIKDGWIVFIEQTERPAHDGLIDELCVVKTTEGKLYVRFIKKGRLPDRWDLLSVTGPAVHDAELEWAAPVTWVKPHTLSKTEIQALRDAPTGYGGTELEE